MTSDCNIATSEQHLYQTIVQFDETIVLSRKLATGNIHDSPLVCILFEVLRIGQCVIKSLCITGAYDVYSLRLSV